MRRSKISVSRTLTPPNTLTGIIIIPNPKQLLPRKLDPLKSIFGHEARNKCHEGDEERADVDLAGAVRATLAEHQHSWPGTEEDGHGRRNPLPGHDEQSASDAPRNDSSG